MLALGLAGCDVGSGSAESTPASGVSGSDASGSGSVQATTVDGLDAEFSALFVERESDAALTALVEAKTAECMASRGFEYPVGAAAAPISEAAPSQSSSSYGAVSFLIAPAGPSEEAAPNEVDAYRQTLSAEEALAFDAALNGQPGPVVEDYEGNPGIDVPDGTVAGATRPSEPSQTGETQGCADIAGQEVNSSLPENNPVYSEILDDYYETVRTDKQMVESTVTWSSCVEGKTSLVAETVAPMDLTRSTIDDVVVVSIANRLGLTSRWITYAEAEEIDISQLEAPIVSGDPVSGWAYLVWGSRDEVSSTALAAAVERENEIQTADTECWQASGGPERIAQIQAEVMDKVAQLSASG